MKTLYLIISIVLLSVTGSAQDKIIRNNGYGFDCKILKEDSVNVHFIIHEGDKDLTTFLSKDQIKEIIYDVSIAKSYSDPIFIKNEEGIFRYYMNGEELAIQDLSKVLAVNRMAFDEFSDSKEMRNSSIIFGFAGGFLVGYPIGEFAANKQPHWYLAGIGAGLIVISIPLAVSAKNKLFNAVNTYNQGIKKESMLKPEIQFGFTGNGIGLRLRF